MFPFNNSFVFFTLVCGLGFVRCLVELPDEDYNDIVITEAVIRETVNNLFATFRTKDVGHEPRLKDFSIIHDFFVSITLKDCDNLKKIARLSQVYNIDNNTLHFMTQINEVLDESDKSNETTDDIHVNTLIEKFINKLRNLKKLYKFNRNLTNFSINAKVLEHFNDHEVTVTNITKKVEDAQISDEEIWRPMEASGRRIFNGHRTRVKHFPFIASVHFFEKFQCAGNIIKKDLVITAASCLQLAWNNRFFRENPSFLSVQVGSNFYEASGEHIPILEVYFHPEYTPMTLTNNLAIMRLSLHIVLNKHPRVKRVEYDQSPLPLPVNINGIVIVGWGAKDRTNIVYDPWVNRLSFAELDYYSLIDCQEVYSKEYVTQKNFCAGFFSKGSGACQNDVGGPGLSGGILVGVISFGPPTCGTPDAPTVFTKVGFYKDWINSIVGKPIPVSIRQTTLQQPKTVHAPYHSEITTTTFKMQPIYTKNRNSIKMALPVNTLRILEDNKLFQEFISTMFENENKENFHSSKNTTDSENGNTKKHVKKKVKSTITTTTTTTTSRTVSAYSSESSEQDSEMDSEKEIRSPPSITSDSTTDEDTHEDEEEKRTKTKTTHKKKETKSIKRHTSSTKRVNSNKKTKYDAWLKPKVNSTTLLKSPKGVKYSNKNKKDDVPKIKAIEEENDISSAEKDEEEKRTKTKTTHKKKATKSIKRHTSSTKRVNSSKKKKYGAWLKPKVNSRTLLKSPKVVKYNNKNKEDDVPKMKAIEEENNISSAEKALKLLDDDMLFRDLLSSVLGSEKKNEFNLSDNKSLTDSTELVTAKHSIKNKHPKENKNKPKLTTTISPLPYETEYVDEYENEYRDKNIDENEYIDKDDGKGDDNDNENDDDRGIGEGKNKDDVFNRYEIEVEDEEENKGEDGDKYENENMRKHMSATDGGKINNDDTELEKEITDLLDDLDMHKLLESVEDSNTAHKEKKTPTEIMKNQVSNKNNKKSKVKHMQTASSSNE